MSTSRLSALKMVSEQWTPKPRQRTLGDAGKQVFMYDEESGETVSNFSISVNTCGCCRSIRRCIRRPKLWWMLLSIFSFVIIMLFSSFFAVWYWRVRKTVRSISQDSTKALRRYAQVTEESVDNLTEQIDLRDMDAAKLAIVGYLDMPFLAVELLGSAMDEEYIRLHEVEQTAKYLYSLYRTLPSLQSDSALVMQPRVEGSVMQPRVEGVFYADRTGTYMSYANQCSRRDSPNCLAEAGKRTFSVGFDYRPGDSADLNSSNCVFKCPPAGSLNSGFINFYTVNAVSGKPEIWFGSKQYDPIGRPWYDTAVLAKGISGWSSVYTDLLYEDGGHPDVGFSVAKAHFDDGEVDMVVGATLTLRHMTEIMRQYEKHKESCFFIVDLNNGKMVANSRGFEFVVCKRSDCLLNSQLLWNESGHDPTVKALRSISAKFGGSLAKVSEKDVLESEVPSEYLYSWERISHGNGAFALSWLLVHVQPANFYKGTVDHELELRENFLLETVSAAEERLNSSMALTLTICIALVTIGSLLLACISRLVTQPLKSIVRDMRAVAKLDLDNIDTLLDSEQSEGVLGWSSCRIQEIAVMRETFADMAKGLRSFSRYMDPYVVQVLIQSRQQAQLRVAKAEVTIFFSDIADFTRVAEAVEPSVLMDLLGEYLETMSGVIMKHQGVIGEFIGDAIMAWWNVPWEIEGCHTAAALVATMEQQQRLSELRARWCQQGLPEIRARMGIARGEVLAGNIGSHNRMKYGLVGDSVNLASRLEGLCKRYSVKALIEDQARNAPGVQHNFYCRPIDLVTVKGRVGTTELYELVACRLQVDGTTLADMYDRFCDDFERVHELYHQRQFSEALDILVEYQQLWPSDVPAQIMRERCERCLAEPPGEDWSPVENLMEK